MWIGGEAVSARDNGWFDTLDPYTGKPWARIARGTAIDAERAVAAAHRAFCEGVWPTLTPTARGALLRRLGDVLTAHAEELADLEVRDNGKLAAEMRAQLSYLPQWFHYYGGLADKLEGAVVPIDKPDVMACTRHEPLGVISAITAWNSPLLLATFKIAPALAAGNTIVLKPSEHASASSLRFARILEANGLPPGVLNVVTGIGGELGDVLFTDERVRKIAFTGGERSARTIAAAAGAAFKPTILELGGKSPNIVFADADIPRAVAGVISGIFAASGQTCVAGSRLLVQRSIHDDFVRRVCAIVDVAVLGDPRQPTTQVGPITTRAQFEHVLNLIETGKREGALCVSGGVQAPHPEGLDGLFVAPTVFTAVTNSMTIAQEEFFGPVLCVIPFDTEDEAIAIANDTRYGLAAGVWTTDINRALRVERRLQAGTVWINAYRMVSFTMPFGGYKQSGTGRENGIDAIRAFTQTKSVMIDTSNAAGNPFILR